MMHEASPQVSTTHNASGKTNTEYAIAPYFARSPLIPVNGLSTLETRLKVITEIDSVNPRSTEPDLDCDLAMAYRQLS